jgi:DNA processing protein
MKNNDLQYKIALLRTENIGLKTLQYLQQKYGNCENAYEKIHNLGDLYSKKISLYPLQQVYQEQELLNEYGGDFYQFKDYIFSYIGNKNLLKNNLISIIGAREVSSNGKIFARNMAQNMNLYTTVSGFSRGVDSIIHSNSSTTIAVLPCGLSYIYPSENKALYEKIKEEGLLISQFQFATPPTRYSFLERNRLIATLSPSLILIEGKMNSGSFYTTQYAKRIEKTIYAVPGHPYDENYKANNFFLKTGAFLFENINDLQQVIKEEKKDYYETSIDLKIAKEIFNLISQKKRTLDIFNTLQIPRITFKSILIELSIFYPHLKEDLFYYF